MDLPTCPSCGASVLDEDAAECPFCGASMNTSASAPAKAKTPPAQQSAASKGQQVKRSKRETVSDDDPFELERKQQSGKAIPLLRKPVKGKMFRVVCPMCDTPGFASSKVVGKEVKCRNPECLAPVFLVPNPEAQERKTDDKPKPETNQNSKLPLIAAIVVSVAVIGGSYFYFTQVPDGSDLAKPFDLPAISNASRKSSSPDSEHEKVSPLSENANQNQDNNPQSNQTTVSTAEVQQAALQKIVDLSRSRKNRSKPFSRRLAAEAYAVTGDIPAAREQIGRIDAVSPPLPFYKIFPLIKIGWDQLKDKDQAGLKQTLDQTIELSQKIPEFGGRDSLDLISRLAAFWVATGKEELAIDLIKKYQAENNLAQLSAYLQIAQETNNHNFVSLIDLHHLWDSPQWVATTMILVAHGYPEEALNWAAMAPDSADRTEAVTQWSLSQLEQAVKRQQKPELSLIQPAEQKISPTGNASMLARCARKLVALKQTEEARQFLAKAISILKDKPIPDTIKLGDIKEVNSMTLPQAAPLELLAESYVQIACAAGELGQKSEALQYLKNAIQSIRATAPSTVAVQEKISETSNFNFQDQIKEALNLNTADRIRRGVNNYRKQLRDLKSASEQRSEQLVRLLSQAVRSGLAPETWALVQETIKDNNINQKDLLLETSLPAIILESLDPSNSAVKTQIDQALMQKKPQLSKEDELIRQTVALIKNGKPEQAAHLINQANLKKPWKGQLSLRLLSSLINASQFDQAVQFITATKDPVLREDMLNTIGSVAAEKNQIATISKLLDSSSNYTPTERISGYLGLINGIQSAKAQQTSTPPPKEPAKKL